MISKNRGFTLAEMMVTLGLSSIMLTLMTPLYQEMAATQQNAYAEKHKFNNLLIGQALLSAASGKGAKGQLPPPYTGGGYTNAIYNPNDTSTPGTSLTQELLKQGVLQTEINDDGTVTSRVRVYQMVSGLTQMVPLFFQSGPVVQLTYQYGAIYLTECPKASLSCNPTSTSGVPGDSPALTAMNFNSWTSKGSDGVATTISTLSLQKQMLGATAERLNKVRDAFIFYMRGRQITAAAGDTTNWYPSGSSSMGGALPSSNQGCRDGWYPLSSGDLLATIGLSTSEYATTTWGGAIQFCRDYDPTGSKGANASPHFAALRINSNVSLGIDPDPTVLGNNVVLTF